MSRVENGRQTAGEKEEETGQKFKVIKGSTTKRRKDKWRSEENKRRKSLRKGSETYEQFDSLYNILLLLYNIFFRENYNQEKPESRDSDGMTQGKK